jgi:hypothetical protein
MLTGFILIIVQIKFTAQRSDDTPASIIDSDSSFGWGH